VKGGTYGFVQQNASTSYTGSSNSVSFTSNPASGDLIMVAVEYTGTLAATPVTDTLGNTFTHTGTAMTSHGSKKTTVYYAKNITGGGADAVTVSFTAATAVSEVYITEYSGINTTSPIDVTANATGSSSGTASASGTTTVPGDIIYAFCFVDSSKGCTAGSGFTPRSTANSNLVEDETSTLAGSYTATATAGSSWTMQMVALKPASGMAPSYGFSIGGISNIGSSMAMGDFNNDTIKDLLAASGSTAAAVIWGQNSSYSWPATINLGSLPADGSRGVVITCSGYAGWNYSGCNFGVAGVGDINGDGVDDVMLVGPSPNSPNSSIFVMYGNAGGAGTPPWPGNWNGGTATNAITFGGSFSSGVGTVIDVNYPWGITDLTMADISGDGKKDLLTNGANYCTTYAGSQCDFNYTAIFSNAPAGATYWDVNSNLTGNNGYMLNLYNGDWVDFLNSDSGPVTGDLNHDGINDLAFGNGTFSPNGVSNAGSTYIVWGKSNSYPYTANSSTAYPNSGQFDTSSTYQNTAWIRLDGDYTNEGSGANVATGDMDHDGNTDVAIAAPGNTPSSNNVTGAGSVYVIFGGPKLPAEISGGASTLENVINR